MDEPSVSPHRVTQLLEQWSHGDDAALGELTPLIYEELRRLAHHHMGGGGKIKVELDEAAIVSPEQSKAIVDLHEALERLGTLDSRKARVVELKYFGGLNHGEIAEVMKISTVTVRRDWVFAKAWLYTELRNVD